jgi:hypothetical protein
MNDNVGEMPLDIYSDYVSDTLGIFFPWEYLVPLICELGFQTGNGYGCGIYYSDAMSLDCCRGNGNFYGYNRGHSYRYITAHLQTYKMGNGTFHIGNG